MLYVAGALVWMATLDYAVTWWTRPGETVVLSTLRASLCLAVATTIMITPLAGIVNGASGIPNLALFVGIALVNVGVWLFQPVVVHFTDPGGRKGRTVTGPMLGLMLVGQAMTFWLMGPTENTRNLPFTEGHRSWVLEYTVLSLLLPTLTAAQLALLSYRWNKVVIDRKLRWRTHLQMAGWMIIGVCAVHICLATALQKLGLAYPLGWLETANALMAPVGFGLLNSGLVFALYGWVRQYRAYRRIEGLWRALLGARAAEIGRPSRPSLRGMGLLLDDRQQQIYDAALDLLPYTDTATLEEARALAAEHAEGRTREAHAVAATLAAAIEARRCGVKAAGTPDHGLLAAEEELRFLVEVGQAFDRSPMVSWARRGVTAAS